MASAQTPDAAAASGSGGADNPVAQVRKDMSWEYGPFVNGGTGLGNRDNFQFLSAGVQVGKPLTPVLRAGIFSGQFEYGVNIMPLWQAYTPAPHEQTFFYTGVIARRERNAPLRGPMAAAPTTASALPR